MFNINLVVSYYFLFFHFVLCTCTFILEINVVIFRDRIALDISFVIFISYLNNIYLIYFYCLKCKKICGGLTKLNCTHKFKGTTTQKKIVYVPIYLPNIM